MDAKTNRTAHIRAWVQEAGGPAEFVRRYGTGRKWQPAQVSQWVSEANPKGIGHALARELEEAKGAPPGSMDHPAATSQSAILDPAKLAASIKFAEDLFRAYGKAFVAADQSMLLAAIYAELLATPEPNLVEMATRYGRGMDERQRAIAGAGTDDRAGAGKSTAKAKAKAGR